MERNLRFCKRIRTLPNSFDREQLNFSLELAFPLFRLAYLLEKMIDNSEGRSGLRANPDALIPAKYLCKKAIRHQNWPSDQ